MEKLSQKHIENILALTPLQEGMLFHYLQDPQSELYFEQLSLDISGVIEHGLFEDAWNDVIKANEMLRVAFRWEKVDNPVQIVLKGRQFQPRYIDLTGIGSSERKELLEEIKKKDTQEKFNLYEVPFRVTLCKMDKDEYTMIISNHHILYDGWSTGIILKEFFKAYHELSRGKRLHKLPVKPPFNEFIKWFQSQDKNKQQQFWREYLAGIEAATELPIKRKLEEKAGRKVEGCSIILEEDIRSKLDIFVKNSRVTLASVFYTGWGVLLQKYCGSEDVIFGTTVSGRSAAVKGIEDMVGLFINTIPLRIQTAPGEKIGDLVFRIDKIMQEREEFESTPLVNIGSYSSVSSGGSLFDTIVVIENYPLDNRLVPDGCLLSIHSYSMAEMTHYDLSVGIMLFDEIEIKFSGKQALFEKETIENLARHFKGIVQYLVENPEMALSQLEIITIEEKNRILFELNNTTAEYPWDKTIHQLFEEQTSKTPDLVGIVGHVGHVGHVGLSYRKLNEQSDRLAQILIEKGVLVNNIVGIMVEPSDEMAIGILGILKAGGAYLPIAPEYPQERINYMLKDSGAKLLVVANDREGEKVCCRDVARNVSTNFLPSYLLNSSNLAYVIYTSGSTGQPKGVLVEHCGLLNYTCWRINTYRLTQKDVTLELLSYTFDGFGSNFYSGLLSGGTLIMIPNSKKLDYQYIKEIVRREGVTNISLVPGMYEVLVDIAEAEDLRSLRFVVLAGERAGKTLLDKSFTKKPGILHINEYGPTEATVTAVARVGMDKDQTVVIGKPIANTHIYILDNRFKIVPIGVPGQLCIEGVGVARGYLNNPELTAEKFIKNRSNRTHKTYIIYKTGDLARWLPDGNLEYLGRMDQQVKIRGFRIEIGEIEDRLLKHGHVKAAVVIATESNIPHLCAYIVLKNEESGIFEKAPDAAALREYLSHRLPDYMIPSHFFLLEKIPLTPGGKVDRKALQAANTPLGTEMEYVSPKNDIERTIADIWKELLGLEKVGIHDNFFDLGGNSLSIIRLNSRLKQALPDKKDISVVTLFNYPTVSSLARYLDREEQEAVNLDETEAGKVKSRIESSKSEIAVIGMAGRFPGAKDIQEFWDNIKNGRESIRFFSKEQLVQMGVEVELINNPDYVPAKGVLENKENFDSFFFGYTPTEAKILDPQVRIFHECTWEALENSGYDPFRYDGAVGLYAGASPNPLWEISPFTSRAVDSSYSEIWNALQFSDKDYLSTRVAYKLDLKGPCVTIQTACSTSLVAVDHACRALVSGACTIALAGGVSVTFQDEGGYLYQEGTIMSPDGHCRAFDAGAKGTVGGNGVGVVVLKRLEEAKNDRDTIYAVIKGFAINNDGRNKVGFTAPSSEGQSKAIRDALHMAKVKPETIGYIETHGTGTPLGDPIEMEGLKLAFNAAGSRKTKYCAIGSVKTNIGHLDAASGIAGFIKTVLSLYHQFIPPSLNFKAPNPQIDFENSPFYVNTELQNWKGNGYPLRAGVSSFGLGGTNVHVILEEWNKKNSREEREERKEKLLLISARTPSALNKMTENLAHHFEQHPNINLANAAYTLQIGRRAFNSRKMLVCSNLHDAIRKLKTNEAETAAAKEEKHTVIFMFSGQGSQYVNMGLDLYKNEPLFRNRIDECFQLLKNITGINMKPILYPDEENIIDAEEKIFQFRYTTPIKFIFEYSLAKLLMTWGINPDAMIGHSFGEYAAACLSGVFSLEDGLFLAALRGELMHGLPDGAMLSVPLPEKELKQRLTIENKLDIAAVNAQSLCIISGPVEAVNRFEEQLNREGHECLRLQVPKAGHSRMVEPIMAEFKQKIAKVKFAKPRIPFISCASGTWITAEQAVDPGYWARHLRGAVRFADGLTTLFKEPNPVFLQASPGKGLILFINQHPDNKEDTLTLSMVRHRKEPASDVHHILAQVGRLWLHGCETRIDWQAFSKGDGEKRQRIPLPSYPFEAIHYPVNRDLFKPGSPVIPSFSKEAGRDKRDELRKKVNIAEWFYVPSWERGMLPGGPAIQIKEQSCASPGVLLFMDRWGIGSLLKKRLEQDGVYVITVHPGTAFKKLDERGYTLNPSDKENYNELLRELETQGEIPTRICHLWSLSRWDADKPAKYSVNDALDSGFYSLLFLVQAIGKRNTNTNHEIHIEVVTGNGLEVNGEEDLNPAIATVYGLCRVIPQEYPDIDCRCIDITLPITLPLVPGDTIGEKRVKQLSAEFLSGSPDRVVAYRGDYRWVETFKLLRLEKPQPGTLPLKERGVYVITGGLGAIGMVLAEHLAKTFKARLILTGRSDFPHRQEWERGLERGRFSRKIQRLLAMEAAGAEVLVLKADVSSLEQMQAVFQKAEEKFGPINGVIHSAGIIGEKSFCPLKDMGRADAQLHFEPKIDGLLVLEEILKNRPVDFCLLMSSTASVLGGLGFGAYSAANRFMDAYIYLLNRTGRTRWLSVNWDGWQLEEKQIGDTVLGAEITELAMTPQEGVEVFERILGFPEVKQVIECTGDLQSRIDRWVKLQELKSPNGEAEAGAETEKPISVLRQQRPQLSSLYIPPQSSREKEVAGIWENLLGYEHIGVQDNFFELNGDSLKAVIAISKIHKQVDVKVPLKDFFANPTIEGLVQYITQAKRGTYYSIEAVEKKEYYPLSSQQEGMYILNRYEAERESTAYNMPTVMELGGDLDVEKFKGIFQELIRRHESLRTSFMMMDDKPVQRIHDELEFEIEYKNLSTDCTDCTDEKDDKIQHSTFIIHHFVRPFDLSKAPLLRVGLLKIEERKHLAIVDVHHIVSDGTSMGGLVKEFMDLYEGGGKNLPPLSIQYKDYACWQGSERESERIKRQGDYWLRELAGEIPVLELPFDYDRALAWDFEGGHVWFELGKEETDGLRALARVGDATLYMVLVSVYLVLLSKLSGQDEIVIGAPMAGRRHPDLQNVFGMFVNTLALRSFVDGNKSYRDFLEALQPRILAAFENQDYPFEELVNQKAAHREVGRNPLFDVTFVLQNMEIPEINIPGLDLKPFPFESKSAKLDLALIAEESGESLLFAFEYRVKLFKHETVERFSRYFRQALWEVLENPEQRICDIKIIPVEEKRRLLVDFNETYVDYPGDKTLHQLFEEQVERTPDFVGIVGPFGHVGHVGLSYGKLNEQSNQLAGVLIERGVLADNIVAIMMERSIEMVVGILGILKSGGAYLPIDPESPQDRIDYMLKDSGANLLVIANDQEGEKVRRWEVEKVILEEIFKSPKISSYLLTFLPSYLLNSSNLAYAIYTSGTTGKPKGVLVEHRNAVNTVNWFAVVHKMGSSTRMLQISNFTFDASVDQIFGTLISGAGLYIVGKELRADFEKLRNYINYQAINIINFVPAFLKELLGYVDKLESLQTVISGAEKLDEAVKEVIIGKGYRLVNQYGPTETAIDALALECSAEKVSLGKPIFNVNVYILDKYEKIVPMGVVGELYITGAGVARGYLNRPELTSEKFIKYRSYRTNRTYINYKTGDLARWLPDGNIEFLGRIDYQAKIRGFRIELGEIENRLLKHDRVKDTVVLIKEDENSDKYLAAYFVSDHEIAEAELREYLAKDLPEYMIPAYFMRLEKLPLTPSGKLDRKALPAPKARETAAYAAPRNEIEMKLMEIWSDVLATNITLNQVGIDDNFFRLGGHSLKATSLASRVYNEFNVKIPLSEIFKRPTIRGLFDYINRAVGEQYTRIEPVEEKQYYELSSAQRRLYFLQQMDAAGTAYNISAAWVLEGVVNRDKLEETFVRLIKRHESLRTSFVIIDEEPVQRIYEQAEFKIEELRIRDRELDVIRPFDLSKAPLLRVGLAQLTENTHLLAVAMHHIISDGMSIQILIREFISLFPGKELPGIKLQYKDYAEWQNREKGGENILKQGAYWKKKFAGEIPLLNLPTDYRRPAVQSFEGSSINFAINKQTSDVLVALAMENGATLYMLLLALYTILLAKLSGREDIVIGSPVAARRHPDLEKIIGMFVNTLALRIYPSAGKKFGDFLGEVRQIALKGFENQEYQYEDLIEQLSVNRDAGRNPLFDAVFVLQNIGSQQVEIPGLKLVPYEYENKTAKFDLTLTAVETEDNLSFTFEYCTKLFKRETIERFIAYFLNIIEGASENKQKSISDIEIITPLEKKRILFDFNDTETGYPKDITIHRLFTGQSSKTPDRIAVVGHGRTRTNTDNNVERLRATSLHITYLQLNEQSDRLAGLLIEKGVLQDNIVGIMAERSLETIVGIMGILKSGGAYLPIDPGLPQERIDYMLKDSGAKLLVVAGDREGETVCCRDIAFCRDVARNVSTKISPSYLLNSSHLCYIIYTSGTTGKPKGVLIEHKNVVRLLFNDRFQFDFNDRDVWSLFHSFSFDFSVWEMYGALLYGGRLAVIPQMTARDPHLFLQVLSDQKVTVLNQTPSAFYNLIDEELKSAKKDLRLRYVIFGGEALKPGRLKTWRKKYPGTKLVNMFGITETCVHVTYKEISEIEIEGDISNIGKPIPTLSTYIMDRDQRLTTIGTPGELYVGGEGVARGYLNRPELTSERFVENFYKTGERLYRSGDLARICPDGEMVYLGRVDHQVQLRGFRIELGEIENRLLKYEGIKEVVVIEQSMPSGDLFLCAYIVPQPGVQTVDLETASIREFLSRQLPDYMIPSYYVPLENIPLTSNGKVDRKKLPLPEVRMEKDHKPPRNKTEEKLADAWKGVLGLETVGIEDDFFDVGGDSIKAIRLISRINEKLNSNLKIVDLYTNKTIGELAGLVDREESDSLQALYRKVTSDLEALKARSMEQLAQHNSAIVDHIENIYPMSDIEKGMVFYYMKHAGTGIYHDQFVYSLDYEGFDADLFKQTLTLLAKKHEILRTGFNIEEFEEPMHVVYKEPKLNFSVTDLSGLPPAQQREQVRLFIEEDRRNPFEIMNPPLWRMHIYTIGNNRIYLLFIFHHAILDGWSAATLMSELHTTYTELKRNPSYVPAGLKSSYRDMVIQERVEKENEWTRRYWREELSDYVRLDFSETTKSKDEMGAMRVYVYNGGEEILARARQAAAQCNTHIKNLFFSAYAYMMRMFSYENDMVLGCVTNNRTGDSDGDKVLGCFLNTAPVRLKIPGDITWKEYIVWMEKKMLELKKHERLPLFEIALVIGEKNKDRNPLFDTIFNFTDFHIYRQAGIGEKGGVLEIENDDSLAIEGHQDTNTLFDFEVDITMGKLLIHPKYNAASISAEMVKKCCVYFVNILNKYINDPESPASRDDILLPEEKEKLLYLFNDTKAPYSREKTMHLLFEEQVLKTQDNTAVIDVDGLRYLTYRELNEQSNRLANGLRKMGIEVGDFVGVVMERRMEMVLAVMAILKAGGAYVPLEPYLPDRRIEKILESLETKCVVTDSCTRPRLETMGASLGCLNHIVSLDKMGYREFAHYSVENPTPASGPGDVSYVIYTSGSTGTPKGVVETHRPVVNVVEWVNKTFEVGAKDKLLFVASLGFDLSVYDIFGLLSSGGAIRTAGAADMKEPLRLLEIIVKEGISFWDSAPAALQRLVPFFGDVREDGSVTGLRLVFLSGDWIPVSMPDALRETFKGVRVISLGGATEATVWSNYYPIGNVDPSWPSIPYGKPIQNAKYYILDTSLNLCPIKIPGDLYIGGECLAKEYKNDPGLTAGKFIENPFCPGERLYKTGDIARWFEDGNMQFLGRKDHQVKIRGYRIELGEIESQLSGFPGIRETIVIDRKDGNGNKYICVYYTVENAGERIEKEELISYLSGELPEYMMPTHFIPIEHVPVTPNGKLDRNALPEPGLNMANVSYAAPEDEVQEKLLGIWKEVLFAPGEEKGLIGINDDFFELGGHSLNATLVISKIHKLANVKIPLAEMFRHPTIRELAELIKTSRKEKYAEINAVEKKEYYHLSSAQKRLYILQQLNPGASAYNIPEIIPLPAESDWRKIAAIFKELIKRHESLRTSFHMVNDIPVQKIHEHVEFETTDYTDYTDHTDIRSFIRPFDLSHAPLMRVSLKKNSDGTFILLVDMHHIISDGVSHQVLAREYQALYNEEALSPIRIQYKDFSEWQNHLVETGAIKKQEFYWLSEFNGKIALLNMPLDYERTGDMHFEGGYVVFELDESLTLKVKKLARQLGVTLMMFFFSLYGILLGTFAGQDEIIIGTVTAGRPHADLQDIIGFFVNMLAVRIFPRKDKLFSDYLREVKEKILNAFENQEYQFEELISKIDILRQPGRHPLVDVVFTYNVNAGGANPWENPLIGEELNSRNMSHADLILHANETVDSIRMCFEYSSRLFKTSTIEDLAAFYTDILEQLVENPGIQLQDIKLAMGLLAAPAAVIRDDQEDWEI